MRTYMYKHKTQSTRNAQLTYYSIIKNLLKSISFRDDRKHNQPSCNERRLPTPKRHILCRVAR